MVHMQPQLPLAFEEAVRHTHCGICGRALRNPKSVALGIGPVCLARYVPELADRKAGRVDKHGHISDMFLHEPHIREALVIRRGAGGEVETNVPHAVVHHSPTGYEFGYGGSGPADLALNICEIAVAHLVPGADHKAVETWDGTGCSFEAWKIHHDFKFKYIAPLDQEGSYKVPWEEVERGVKDLLAKRGREIAEEYETRQLLSELER